MIVLINDWLYWIVVIRGQFMVKDTWNKGEEQIEQAETV